MRLQARQTSLRLESVWTFPSGQRSSELRKSSRNDARALGIEREEAVVDDTVELPRAGHRANHVRYPGSGSYVYIGAKTEHPLASSQRGHRLLLRLARSSNDQDAYL